MTQRTPSPKNSFRYKAALIFAVTSVLPLLLFLFVLDRYDLLQETEVALILGLSLLISGLGYLFFRQIVKQVTTLAENFHKIEEGELEQIGECEVPEEISEMARIADSFNKILIELKANTKELENMIYKLSTLSELTELVSRIPDIKEVLKVVLHRTMTTVNAKRGSIMLLDDKKKALTIEAAEGLEEEVVANTSISLGEGIAGTVAQIGESVLVEDMENDPRFGKPNNPKYETSSFICMPLKTRERVIGVLSLSKKGGRIVFSESDLKFLTTLLHHISFAVENARLLKEAKEVATQLQKTIHEKSLQLNLAQQQVLQSAKLSALGELVAGVAHELNNPLTTVSGCSELLLGKTLDEKIRKEITKIMEESQRATKIIRDLLSFARRKTPEKRPCDINQSLSAVIDICISELLAHNIDLTTKLSPSLPLIMVDENQIKQVFLNIVNNARQAMLGQEKPGKLLITTEWDGERVRIEFTDTGPGIKVQDLEHVFDPFFTTKAQDQGTGLGLSVSYGIVKAHEGNIFVRSHEKEGAAFVVELPGLLGEARAIEVKSPDYKEAKLPINNILVIDDDKNVNELIANILQEKGCQAETALEGNHGLQMLLEKEYDLIICDLQMPGLDGRQIYLEARQAKPQLTSRFIFITGDTISDGPRTFLESTGTPYIAKPFTIDAFWSLIVQTWEQNQIIGHIGADSMECEEAGKRAKAAH